MCSQQQCIITGISLEHKCSWDEQKKKSFMLLNVTIWKWTHQKNKYVLCSMFNMKILFLRKL